MPFWIFMLAMNLLIPATMIGFGAYFCKKAPRDINAFFGYRTPRSMASCEAWAFAHRMCGKIWLIIGLVILPLTVGGMCLLLGEPQDAVGLWGGLICVAQLVPLMATVIPVEIALHRNFYPNGDRKHK